jgi:hypothetical protein
MTIKKKTERRMSLPEANRLGDMVMAMLRHTPFIEECSFDALPVPGPLWVCYPPGADDAFTVSGLGQTKQRAYVNMLVAFDEWSKTHAPKGQHDIKHVNSDHKE